MSFNSSEPNEMISGIVVMNISDQEFYADIKDVYTIVNPNELDQPSLFSQIFAYLVLDELHIPLIDIHKLFGLKKHIDGKESRVVVIEVNDKILAFFVDSVKEVITLSQDLKEKLVFVPTRGNTYLGGILKYKDRSIYLPDFQRISQDYFVKVQ